MNAPTQSDKIEFSPMEMTIHGTNMNAAEGRIVRSAVDNPDEAAVSESVVRDVRGSLRSHVSTETVDQELKTILRATGRSESRGGRHVSLLVAPGTLTPIMRMAAAVRAWEVVPDANHAIVVTVVMEVVVKWVLEDGAKNGVGAREVLLEEDSAMADRGRTRIDANHEKSEVASVGAKTPPASTIVRKGSDVRAVTASEA